MKKIIVFLLLPMYIFVSLSSCGDDIFQKEDPYKRAKEKHRFFRCKINGKEWHSETYSDGWFGGDDSYMSFYEAPDSVEKSGRFKIAVDYIPNKDQVVYECMVIEVERGLIEGVNDIDYIRYCLISPISKSFYLDTTYQNELFITDIDTANLIIKGTFEFRAITFDKIDTIIVNDGEFDWEPVWYRWK